MTSAYANLHVHRVPMREHSRLPDAVRFCYRCRSVVAFARVVSVPIDPESYYGPTCRVECDRGHRDGDLFPGRVREWGEG